MSLVEAEMSTFWPSIRRERMRYLEANLGGGTRTEVIGMLAAKLSAAIRGDQEFKDAASAAGLVADDYDAERLQFGYLMNKRRELDSGLQFGAKTQLDVLRLMRGTGAVTLLFKGGTDTVNKASSQARKAQSNLYLAKVRTTQAKLAELRSDNSLTRAERTARAQQIREEGAEDIAATREELAVRNKAFAKSRKQFQKGLERIGKIALTIAIGAATFGQGIVAVIVGSILGGIAKEAGAALARWAVQGDAYEHKDLARAVAIGAVTGALKAATAEVMTVIDAGAGLVAADPMAAGALANNAIYGQVAMNAAIGAAVRSAVVDIPKAELKYLLTVERPFRDFGRNLDVMLATHITNAAGRQAAQVLGAVLGQAAHDVDTLFTQAVGPQPSDSASQKAAAFFTGQAQTGVNMLMSQLAARAKLIKLAFKAAAKKLWGSYPQLWTKLANESVIAMGARKDIVAPGTAASLPDQAEVDRVMALLEELAAGTKKLTDVDATAKVTIGLLIAHDKAGGSA